MANPTSFMKETYNDNTVKSNGAPESATFAIPIATISAANLVAKLALVATLRTALAAVVIGVDAKQEITLKRDVFSANPASSTLAQRENKWLIRYVGNTSNKKFQAAIPTADWSLLPDHSEFLDLTAGVGMDLKDAFEAIAVSPDSDAETVTVTSIQKVSYTT